MDDITLTTILYKYKDQQPKQFGEDFGEKCYPVSAILNICEEYHQMMKQREQKETEQQINCNLPHVSGSVLSINLHEYGYSCGDGCCYNYGTITTVNKTELPCHNQDAGTILKQVLEHLGYCVEITYSDDVS